MTDTLQRPDGNTADSEPLQPHREPACIDVSPDDIEPPLEASTRFKWYKRGIGSVAVATTVLVAQNVDVIDRFEDWNTDNYYLSVPSACAAYVDMERDLRQPLPQADDLDVEIVDSVAEAVSINNNGGSATVAPDLTDEQSSARDIETGGFSIRETAAWAWNFKDYKIAEFTTPTTDDGQGITFNFYSSSPDVHFDIDEQRWSELFLAPITSEFVVADQHFREVRTCLRDGYDLMDQVAGQELDVYVAPDLGYCLAHMRMREIGPEFYSRDCQSQGFTPPRLNVEFLFWHPLDKEFMILTFRDYDDWETINRKINEFVVHEATHFWLNQTNRKFELDPEERFVEAMEMSIIADDSLLIFDGKSAPIVYRQSSRAGTQSND